jgi:hypothetical protein
MSEATPHRLIEQQFVILPTWVLELPVSALSIRVYCVIRSFADVRTGKCFPSRRLIAERAKCSIGSVDTAVRELTALGALTVQKRRSDNGDWTSNIYTVHAQRNAQVAQSTTPPSPNDEVTGGPRNLTVTRSITNHNQYLSGYTLNNDSHRSQATADSAVVDQFLQALRTRTRSL